MNIPVGPLIPSDLNFSTIRTTGLYTNNNFLLPSYSSSDDIIEPILGMLIFNNTNNTLQLYTGSEWETISTSTGWTQKGSKLVGTGNEGIATQGFSVSLSGDGNTLAIGGTYDNTRIGATWIFILSGGSWIQQGSKLVGTEYQGTNPEQGTSVSLSDDGNTLAVGAYLDNTGLGATWIFTRSDGIWTQQGSKLVGTGNIGNSRQGFSVSVSADGNTLAVGGFSDNNLIGATWIFTRTAGVWTQQGSKLVGTGNTGVCLQGVSVSLSSDGNTLAVGGYRDNNFIGATWIFTRSSDVWSQQGSKLLGDDYVGNANQGNSVSLSADGNTLAVAGFADNNNIGATWIFTRSDDVWSQQGSKLVGSGYVGTSVYQGSSISLSDDGNILAIGGYEDGNDGFENYIGATWVFTRTGGVWTQQDSKLVGTGYVGSYIYQGVSVSLSGSGNTLAIGGYTDNSSIGATWIFTN